MSLYNALFGVNAAAPVLLKMLDINPGEIPRFRNCYIDGEHIVIHTRTGGGNREYYDSPNDDNTDGPWNTTFYENEFFVRDEDDDFDCTYANFYFQFPEKYADDLRALTENIEQHKPSDQWKALLNELGTPL